MKAVEIVRVCVLQLVYGGTILYVTERKKFTLPLDFTWLDAKYWINVWNLHGQYFLSELSSADDEWSNCPSVMFHSQDSSQICQPGDDNDSGGLIKGSRTVLTIDAILSCLRKLL